MSDLTGGGTGRAANGGARTTAGPVPVAPADRSNIRTPQMIMNERRQREAARRQQSEAEEQQRKHEEERRRSAERRAQVLAGAAGANPSAETGGTPRQPQSTPLRSGEGAAPRQPERLVPGQQNPQTSGHPPDTGAGAQQHGRPRAGSHTQQQRRPAASSSESRRPPPTQHSRRPSAPADSAQSGPSTTVPQPPPPPGSSTTQQQRQSTSSNFPHAFERWETLSSHWEGLTSYWIRKLESSTEEVRSQPLVQQLSRQITDLSAAGANLFHAVVELQRLRASSERKFQRWFYEHRQEQERAQEREAQLEHTIRVEREARTEAVANMERMATEKRNAERIVVEMKRELQISKEEARRAWEELGRREQEERDRTFSLREGQPTVVGGVQVVPMAQGMGRHGGPSHRTGEETHGAGQSSGSGIEQHYSYEEGQSPTDTDPYTEAARLARHEPDHPSLAQGTYVPSGVASSTRTSASSQPVDQPQIPAPLHYRTTNAQQPPIQPTTTQPEAFYQQPGSYLHRETPTSIPEDERSYVTSQAETSDGEEEWALDERGNPILDEAGHRVPWRAVRRRDSDEYDVEDDRRRELEHLARYGTAATPATGYATTSSAGGSYQQSYTTSNRPDYSGEDYGDEWTGMRHHHPTRLSDVPEEDERSRTSPSRASQHSRGFLY